MEFGNVQGTEEIIADYGYAIAINEAGEDVAVLVWETSSYVHSYRYEGLIDTEFIDEYECKDQLSCS